MPRMTMARTIKLYKLPDKPQVRHRTWKADMAREIASPPSCQLAAMRPMRKEDIESAHLLLSNYLEGWAFSGVTTVL